MSSSLGQDSSYREFSQLLQPNACVLVVPGLRYDSLFLPNPHTYHFSVIPPFQLMAASKKDAPNAFRLLMLSPTLTHNEGCTIAQAVSRRLPTAAARVRARVRSCGSVVDKVTLGQVFSEYFSFPCQSSFHQLLHNHHHLSSGAGTIGQ
jgi:hypothetical protein